MPLRRVILSRPLMRVSYALELFDPSTIVPSLVGFMVVSCFQFAVRRADFVDRRWLEMINNC